MIFSVDKYASIRLKSKISLLIVELYFITPSVTVVVALIKLMRVKTNKLGSKTKYSALNPSLYSLNDGLYCLILMKIAT